jgi:hypothetical protein
LLAKLKRLGYDIPKIRKKDPDTYDIEYKESVAELALRKIYSATASRDIEAILNVRELDTLRRRYVNSKRVCGVFYSCYNVSGASTGRRSASKHTFGVGGNAQTLPKHYNPQAVAYKYGQDFLRGVIARKNKVFFHVDQYAAEDWPICALSENHNGLNELRNAVDRHTNLASFIFGIPVDSRTKLEWKNSPERHLGKSARYARSYGVRGPTLSDALAKEGYSKTPQYCQGILDKVDEYDPNLEGVFHTYIRDTIFKSNTLSTPFGNERHFHGLRPNDKNYKIFNEAYCYIPQSTVAHNTGFSVRQLEKCHKDIVNECHDSITQEPYNDIRYLIETYSRTQRAFDRQITFHNGITVNIPIEGELGFNLLDTIKIKPFTEEGVRLAFEELNDLHPRRESPDEQDSKEKLVTSL